MGVAAVTTYGALLAHKKTGNRINFGDVIGERLCWPAKWARLLSIDFFICPSEYQLFYTQKNLSAMTFGGTLRKHYKTRERLYLSHAHCHVRCE